MNKLASIIFILSCFLNPTLDAGSNTHLFKQIKSRFQTDHVKKNLNQSESYLFKKDFSEERLQVMFPEEPNEFYYKLSEESYNSIISGITESADDDDDYDDWEPKIDFDIFFPKECNSCLVLDENFDYFYFLSVSKLQKCQKQTVDAILTLLTDQRKHYIEENEDPFSDE